MIIWNNEILFYIFFTYIYLYIFIFKIYTCFYIYFYIYLYTLVHLLLNIGIQPEEQFCSSYSLYIYKFIPYICNFKHILLGVRNVLFLLTS